MDLILATSRAVAEDVGLIGTFVVLMGGLVTVIAVYIAIQIRGERQQNREYRASPRNNGGD
jgi:hypothetical protein